MHATYILKLPVGDGGPQQLVRLLVDRGIPLWSRPKWIQPARGNTHESWILATVCCSERQGVLVVHKQFFVQKLPICNKHTALRGTERQPEPYLCPGNTNLHNNALLRHVHEAIRHCLCRAPLVGHILPQLLRQRCQGDGAWERPLIQSRHGRVCACPTTKRTVVIHHVVLKPHHIGHDADWGMPHILGHRIRVVNTW